jgi:hypothetical protein
MCNRNLVSASPAVVFLLSCWSAFGALTTYPGNGSVIYGGAIGNGTLQLNDNGTYINATFNKGGGSGISFRGDLVIFIDSQPGGFNNTASFTENGTELQSAVSGVLLQGTTRANANFAPGFYADYALAIGVNPNGAIFRLIQGDSGPYLDYVTPVNLFPRDNQNMATYSFSFSWENIGLTPQTPTNYFKFESFYASEFGGRYPESFETVTATSVPWGTLNFSNYDIYGVDPVPETTNAALLAFGGLFASTGFLLRMRRKLKN